MTLFALRIFSLVLSVLPGFVHRMVTKALGDFIFHCLPRRRWIILSNLDHAFPDRPRKWLHRIGRQSCRQMIETGLLSLILPHLSLRRVRQMIRIDEDTAARMRAALTGSRPAVFVTPHLGAWEMGTCFPALLGPINRELGCIYRPLDNPQLNAWVVHARSRFGIKMMSRKKGLAAAMRLLRGGGAFFILFDQAAPGSGQLSVLLNRLCLSTPLPGLMVEKFAASLHTCVVQRESFWRYRIESDEIEVPPNAEEITRRLDAWLGDLLRHDERACGTWLWAHNRWKLRQSPETLFRLEQRRSALLEQETIPRTTRFYVRLPDDLRVVLWALPLLRALRVSRPDAALTAITPSAFATLLAGIDLWDEVITAPADRIDRAFARSLYYKFPDYWISFDDSGTTDVEARASRCPERFGIQRAGNRRRQLNRPWNVPPDVDDELEHRFRILERFFRHFGLEGAIDAAPVRLREPLMTPEERTEQAVLFAARDSASATADAWPVERWQQLIRQFTDEAPQPALLLRNLPLASPGAGLIPRHCSWAELATQVQTCRLVVTDDLDLLHLAGALGVPAIGLFGMASTLREGPIFTAPAWVVRPPGCPETGGTPLGELEPGAVLTQIHAALRVPLER